jgi:SAM-dependent methyltransferase
VSLPRAVWQAVRGPGGLARLQALHDSRAAVRLSIGAAALSTGVLPALGTGPLDVDRLVARTGARDAELLVAWLRVLEAARYVRRDGPVWQLTRRGRALLQDGVLRAVHEAFVDYHTGLYRDLPRQLGGGPPRRDVVDHGDVIAELSRGQDPFICSLLVELVGRERPGRVLDVGCGSGSHLAAMLEAAPTAVGVGVDLDHDVVQLARRTLAASSAGPRATVHRGELAALLDEGWLGGGYDLALYANAISYAPVSDRVRVLRQIAAVLADRGLLVVVTTALGDDVFSRHFDLLLRAQNLPGMQLPHLDELVGQLREAGLTPEPPRRLIPLQPLFAVLARRS